MPDEQVVKSYRDMLLMRRFEEKVGQLYGMGLIRGFCHLYIGQEAIAIGLKNVLSSGDSVVTSYREHGFMLSSGESAKSVMAELMGKAAGCSKGKGGSMHMFNVKKNFFGGHGIVGAQVPIGTGIAFAEKYNKSNGVVFTCLGDGAMNQGQVYESLNMAALWKLPVVYVVENNEYAMGTAVTRSSSVPELYKRGEGCGVPGRQVDGMDVFAVIEEAENAAEQCRKGHGPILLEMKTYRFRGHSMSDPAKYRTRQEVEEVRDKRDPLCRLREYILKHSITPESTLEDFETEVRGEVNEAVEFAQSSPEPPVTELYTDVYK
ncbi:pyruvate dehydrogenase (acetyl-transferring) E1 component subunit alpha [Anaplasma capra]|uniref:pyruvate dehydrogenase (acetyl-transferring) E1 component subunit alpha n=1 Tax=Anaplasma capra TaxID=1562740 RepID=UPI0021D5F8D2|nr:pyruvate dehydrogenase (acetyl-transferring) E1 component subunit alpha [Anaplasma capra]MCU7611761.1 pyruvate dehydrogenase (acetyl-transferring) E1 component subunit alpha [Anaplasma capra]MCU7612489.1 pyruvate dehydrogenase (acetyl-transferring) E1 component subunit alpha [Anaplasma capra]